MFLFYELVTPTKTVLSLSLLILIPPFLLNTNSYLFCSISPRRRSRSPRDHHHSRRRSPPPRHRHEGNKEFHGTRVSSSC